MDEREKILEHFSSDGIPSAVYLAGQGHYREPKPMEVQYLRVLRYVQRLNDQCAGYASIAHVLIDLNHPRSSQFDEMGFPQFARLLEMAAKGEISAVFGDLAQYDARLAPFHWVEGALIKHAVPYIDAGLDAGGFVAKDVSERLGPIDAYEVSDAEDMLAFFPGLSHAILNEFIKEAHLSDPSGGHAAREAWEPFRRSLFEEKPYRVQRLPFYWVNKLDRLFRNRDR